MLLLIRDPMYRLAGSADGSVVVAVNRFTPAHQQYVLVLVRIGILWPGITMTVKIAIAGIVLIAAGASGYFARSYWHSAPEPAAERWRQPDGDGEVERSTGKRINEHQRHAG